MKEPNKNIRINNVQLLHSQNSFQKMTGVVRFVKDSRNLHKRKSKSRGQKNPRGKLGKQRSHTKPRGVRLVVQCISWCGTYPDLRDEGVLKTVDSSNINEIHDFCDSQRSVKYQLCVFRKKKAKAKMFYKMLQGH